MRNGENGLLCPNTEEGWYAAIRRLVETGQLRALPPELQEAAALRLAHPEMSLTELGTLADPPIGKSGINHRMRKLLAASGGEEHR